jgi:NAD/NADP transhydrogenase alpha subunit
VLVLGAGVAGLPDRNGSRLGAVITAFDVRPVVRTGREPRPTFLDLGPERGDGGGYARELSEESRADSRTLSPSRFRRSTP